MHRVEIAEKCFRLDFRCNCIIKISSDVFDKIVNSKSYLRRRQISNFLPQNYGKSEQSEVTEGEV